MKTRIVSYRTYSRLNGFKSPAAYKKHLAQLASKLKEYDYDFSVEDQGRLLETFKRAWEINGSVTINKRGQRLN